LNYGGIFNNYFIANLLPSPTAEEMKIGPHRLWRSYGQKESA